MSTTVVMGASVGAKLVTVWGTPSSRMRKFSFLRLVRMSPCCVVATTSTVTMGTSTAIVTPACGGCCAAAGAGGAGFCCGGGGVPPGPAGAWAKTEFSASGQPRAAARIASKTTERMAFIMHPSMAIEKLQTAVTPACGTSGGHEAVEFNQPYGIGQPNAHTCMLV